MKRSLSLGLVVAALLLAVSVAMSQVLPLPATHRATSGRPMHAAGMASHRKVNLNFASKRELMTLPGIGPRTAEKIIAARPFKTRAELVSKRLVTKSEYRMVRNAVTAKQV